MRSILEIIVQWVESWYRGLVLYFAAHIAWFFVIRGGRHSGRVKKVTPKRGIESCAGIGKHKESKGQQTTNSRRSMTAQQRIVRVRRNYNQWVANETLEDYALRFTAKRARRWSTFSVANTAIGAVSFLALEAIGGSITINYGFINATSAILVVGALIFLTSLPIAYYAATYGVDIDLLTRGAGFGYLGSTNHSPFCSLPSKRPSCRLRWKCALACRYSRVTC